VCYLTLKEREPYSYSLLNTSQMSFMLFKAFIVLSSCLGPLLPFSGGPACRLLAVRREPTTVRLLPPLLLVPVVVLVLS